MPQFSGIALPQHPIDWLKLPLALALGAVMGLVVAGASTMSMERMVIVLAAMVMPFGLIIVGSLRRPLLAVIMI